MRNVLMAVAIVLASGCELYSGDDAVTGDDAPAAIVPVQDATACPLPAAEPCPPWWTSCQPLRLRQAECRVMCEGAGTCAGYTVAECFTDCVEHKYEAFCLMP